MKLLKLGDEWEIISSGEISSVWSKCCWDEAVLSAVIRSDVCDLFSFC